MKRGTAIHQELDWLVPGTILTLLSGAFALFETPNAGTLLPELLLLPFWLIAAFGLAAVVTLVAIFRMMREGIEHPVTHCVSYLHDNRKLLLLVAFGMVLTGLNMIAFMWVKPLLNYLIPFRADPLLASVDRFIFGTDPWRLLVYLNTTPLAILYHRGWFALMIITLLVLLMQPASAQKSAVMLTYFLLWSVFGPVVHTLCPAGGPVFYAALGYGNSFSALAMEEETREAARYLWRFYSDQTFGPGAGISAMPSLHIATMAWMVIAVSQFAKRWTLPMMAAAILIFLLSVSLGWHYAVDGMVGSAGAFAIWKISLMVIEKRPRSMRTMVHASL